MPEISVVVPIYKVEKYLKRCIDSILNQSYKDFQLILVDDGSPDNCGQICDEYAMIDERIHVIHRENGGLSAARNSGIDWVFNNSFTEWITFIDSDDWVYEDCLKLLLEANLCNNTYISVCNSTFAYNDNTQPKSITGFRITSPETFWVENQGNAVVAWGKLYKTELFRDIRYPEGKIHEDEFTTHKLLFAQKAISVTNDGLYFYYQSPNSITRSKWNEKKLFAFEAYGEQIVFFRKYGYQNAYKESKKLFVFSIKNHLNQIKQSDDKNKNYRLLKKQIKNYLFKRYNSYLLSSSLFCTLYVKLIIVEQYITIRVSVLKEEYKKSGIKGILKKILK